MNRSRWLWAATIALAAGPAPLWAGSADDLASCIDHRLAARWDQAKVKPAPVADDATFLRRVYLDIVGRIPRVAEARAFLDDPAPDKRRRLVERLLADPAEVEHFTHVWRSWLLPDPEVSPLAAQLAPQFEQWLRQRLAENVGYDRMVREMLTAAPVNRNIRLGEFSGRSSVAQGGAGAFALARENKPENLAGASARLFLGVRLECAQCHDHPRATWTREQFWSYAVLFTPGRKTMRIPETKRSVTARFIDGTAADFQGTGGRAALADWMTRPDNPYFARAAVNRIWAYFFGVGLVEPIDDLSDDNKPSHPKLLDELAQAFVAHKFDLRFLMKAIVLSRAYQLASTLPSGAADNPRLFARRQVKGLGPEQILDSLMQATGMRPPTIGRAAAEAANARALFLARFTHSTEQPTQVQTSLLQALALMNGQLVADATDPERGPVLAAVADAPFMNTAERLETLFLAVLTRKPRPEELATLSAYVESGGPHHNPKRALADVFWALLNSGEFLLSQ